jgi:hypothetical protein
MSHFALVLMSDAKEKDGIQPTFRIIRGQQFDDAEPVLLILPVRLEIVFVLRAQDGQITFPSGVLAQNSRYTDRRFLCISHCYLQGITLRPVPCNYAIQSSEPFHGADAGLNPAAKSMHYERAPPFRRSKLDGAPPPLRCAV